MKQVVKQLCVDCAKRCGEIKESCDFKPREDLLGSPIHFKDPWNRSRKSNLTMCSVCKEYANNIKWLRMQYGYYPLCEECAGRHVWVSKVMPLSAKRSARHCNIKT